MNKMYFEVIDIFRKCSKLQNLVSNQESYDQFRKTIDEASDRIEFLFNQDNDTSETKNLCLEFLDNWVDEVNHSFANFHGLRKEDWPVYANIIANDLEFNGSITDPKILNLWRERHLPQREFFFKNDKMFTCIVLLSILAILASALRGYIQ